MRNGLKLIVAKDPEAIAKIAADYYETLISEKPDCVLGLATGSTPIPLYRELIAREKAGKIDFRKVRSVNLDEYIGLEPTHPQSYRYFMQENLFDHISIDPNNTNVPSGVSEDLEATCLAYEKKIEELGGIDLQLLGIGHDGHIGFNEPCDEFPKITHEVVLEEITRQANKRFFNSIDEVPTKAVTMGIGTVMKADMVLLIATGKGKAEIVRKSFFGPVTPQVPASILQFHPNAVVLVDEAAYSLCK